ncbi:hypothetical protein [Catellatospora chokoriensis]|nr:hypothetical protein [Catellatospora chokoriensis]
MEGLTSVGVAADGGRSYPPEAWLPMDLAMEVLRRCCATGELPDASRDERVARPDGQEPAAQQG